MPGSARARCTALAVLSLALLAPSTTAATPPASGPIVVVAPHPDDETLGCGGIIATRAFEGREVFVIVLTDGRALLRRFGITEAPSEAEVATLRKAETQRAVDILTGGRGHARFLDVPNETLVAHQAETTDTLTSWLRHLRPAEVYVTSPLEGHREHVAANAIVRASCASSAACGAIFEFTVSRRRDGGAPASPRREVAVDVSAHREREYRALQQYRSHLDRLSPKLPAPFETDEYRRYLTPLEVFLVP